MSNISILNHFKDYEEFSLDSDTLLDTALQGTATPTVLLLFSVGIFDWRYIPGALLFTCLLLSLRIKFKIGQDKTTNNMTISNYQDLELVDKIVVSNDTAIYRFSLNSDDDILRIPVGTHLQVSVPINGQNCVRYYTPISSRAEQGAFDLLIKTYPNGKVSQHFSNLKIHQTVKFSGPIGRMSYVCNMTKEIGMIAGGTGISPLLQILAHITINPQDTTNISLIYCNETEDDILLRDELDELAEKFPRIKIHYVLNKPNKKWNGDIGYISEDLISKYLPKPSSNSRLFCCGPDPMMKSVQKFTGDLGWQKSSQPSKQNDQVFIF